MPIEPANALSLVNVYDLLVDTATDFVGAASQVAPAAVRDSICTVGRIASFIGGPVTDFITPGNTFKPSIVIGGILQAACPVPPPVPPEFLPSFKGGQCPGVNYTVTFNLLRRNRSNCNQLPTVAQVGNITGPIRSMTLGGPTVPVACGLNVDMATQIIGVFGPAPTTGPLYSAGGGGNLGIEKVESIDVVRADGLPDVCGDPPIPPRPPRPPIIQPPRSPRIPYVRPDGNPGPDIFIDTRIGPIYVDVDATLKVPVTVSFTGGDIVGNVTIPVSVSLPDFNVTINYGGTGGDPGTPDEPQEPTPPVGICCDPPVPRVEDGKDEDPEEPPVEDPPAAGKILGVIVNSIQISSTSNASTVFTASPPLLVPRIATVQFGLQAGEEQSISSDTQIKQRTQFVPAPQGMDVIRAFIRWEPGWDGEFKYVIGPANRNL